MNDVFNGLKQLEQVTRDLSPLYRALKKPLKNDQTNHQRTRTGPDGAWAPRSASTTARGRSARKGAKGKVVRKRIAGNLLGKLPRAVKYEATGNFVRGTSRVAWGLVHQEGGKAGRGSVIPARPFLWMSDTFLDLASNEVGDRLIVKYGGSK